jgi:hypothetical protein
VLLLCVSSLLGCFPVTELQTPSTLPPGQVQTTLALGAGSGGPHHYPESVGLFNQDIPIDLAVHVGVVKDLELGIRIRPVAAELQAKYQLLRGEPELSVAVAALVAEDVDNPIGDDNPGPISSTLAYAARLTAYLGTAAHHSQSFWLAPTLTLGARSFSKEYGSETHYTWLCAPGFLMGLVFGRASHDHFEVEGGVLFPVGGVGKYQVRMTEYQQTRLGPGDTRFEFSFGYAFGAELEH